MDKKREESSDFSKGSVWKNIMNMALPMTLAQLINILYNIVDRMYIGHIPDAGALALTGLGITFPIITIIGAFANLFGMGGAPLCSIARGQGKNRRAEQIMGNAFTMLVLCGIVLTVAGLLSKRRILYLFGASQSTYYFADSYISIYLLGSVFVMVSLGMNGFINSQGFGKAGMATVAIGAAANIILDPIFIFGLHMGVKGAALATVISQGISAFWVLGFLVSKKAVLTLKRESLILNRGIVKSITALGLSGFVMAITTSLVQIVCNASLKLYGGDIYVGVMTVINSVREVLNMPVNGLTNGSQPVLGYNYGAGEYKRVKTGIKFTAISCVIYTILAWALVMLIPDVLISIFNSSEELIEAGVAAMRVYFMGFCFMALQFSGQSVSVALGKSRQAIFFSLFRKVIIVIPLVILLPRVGNLGVMGVFLAEPISDLIGGTACFSTVLATIWSKL